MSLYRAWESGGLIRSSRSHGKRQDLMDSLQSAVRCSVARFFKWKMLRESGPYALLLPTALDYTGDLIAGERYRFLSRHPLYILRHLTSPPR